MTFAERIQKVKPSPTLAAAAKAKALSAQGTAIINFGLGEPDFDTPAHIKAACVQALEAGDTKYGPVSGHPALRAAIAARFQQDTGVPCQAAQVVVTCGSKEALFAVMQVLLNPGDEIIIPAPFWVSYQDQALLCDARPVIIPTNEATHFKLTPAQLAAHITPRTKLLLLNSPSNPTGTMYSRAELEALAAVCAAHKFWILSDEIYDQLVYPPARFTSVAQAASDLRERTIIINGVSKSYAMTGWRVGWAIAPVPLAKALDTWQGQVVSHATSFAQAGALAAVQGSQECVAKMRATFQERRDLILALLSQIPNLPCVTPDGAFYAFPNVQAYLGTTAGDRRIETSNDLAEYLLDTAHIAVVAGEGFGMPGYLRFSYALATEPLRLGMQQFAQTLQCLARR